MDAVQLDMFADDPNNRPMLLSAIGEGVQNDCGVYTEKEYREKLKQESPTVYAARVASGYYKE